MKSYACCRSFAAGAIACALVAALAAPTAAQAPDASTLAKKIANPLSDIVSVPFQLNWIQGVGPEDETRRVVNIQPVVPLSIGSRWNLIDRVVLPVVSQPAALGSASGVGDTVMSGFFSPKKAVHGVTWGVGPVVSVPLTTDPTLGSGKWSAGPTAVVMTQQGHVLYGALVNQVWSFAGRGDATRSDVSQMLLQPVVSYVTGKGVTVTVMSEMTANWKAVDPGDRWTIPVTAVVSRIQRIGMLPVSLQAGGGVYLVSPNGGPGWQVRTGIVLILPKGRR